MDMSICSELLALLLSLQVAEGCHIHHVSGLTMHSDHKPVFYSITWSHFAVSVIHHMGSAFKLEQRSTAASCHSTVYYCGCKA